MRHRFIATMRLVLHNVAESPKMANLVNWIFLENQAINFP